MSTSGRDEVRGHLAEHLARLWRYALVLTGSGEMAEDLVQATCQRALERAEQFRTGTRLDRWLFAILHSIWLNEVRAERVRRGHGVVDAESVLATDGSAETETVIHARQLIRAVQSLPERQRVTVFLVCVEGLTYGEAAATLGIPVGTVMSRLAAARARLAGLGGMDPAKNGSEALGE